MNKESVLISAAQRRIAMSLVIRETDIVRFVMRNPDLSQREVDQITGIQDFPAQMDLCLAETAEQKLNESNGWFAIRTCGAEYFASKLVPNYKGDMMFWLGVCNGYRHGVKLGEASFLAHAGDTLEIYARRIQAQLEITPHEGLRRDFSAARVGASVSDRIEELKSIINRAPIMIPDEKDPLRALLNEIGEAHDTVVGLGDFIIVSPSENGYWSNGFGWVENKASATPFDRESDVYLLPGVNGDAKVVSFQREATSEDGYRAQPRARIA